MPPPEAGLIPPYPRAPGIPGALNRMTFPCPATSFENCAASDFTSACASCAVLNCSTDDSPSPGVPIHVISRDRSFIARFLAAGYVPGMRPALGGRPPLAMELFLPQLLELFSSPPARAESK